jgi:SAM-dependent methyltransferase
MAEGSSPRSRAGPPVPGGYWFGPLARFLGPAYLRNAFTKGSEQEVAFLVEALGLEPGHRVLDVGCGPGRHALALARRGIAVHGIDASDVFVTLARDAAGAEDLDATFDVVDVAGLDVHGRYDAAVCLCQGGFGLLGGRADVDVFHRIARSVRPGGGVAVSAFHLPFAIRHLEEGEGFDPATGVLHERATLRDDGGAEREFDLWTTCFTARELELLAREAGLRGVAVLGVAPGCYRSAPPDLDAPELLLLARRGPRGAAR